MPSACGKSDIKVAVDSAEAVKQCIIVVEKKVRNLEKRKGKLDIIKAKYAEGEKINTEQKEAISKYDSVLVTLEFARELLKQYAGMVTDYEKQSRKQAKRDKIERLAQDAAKFKQILKLQNLLDNMGAENVRQDFQNGKNGAVLLTEEEFTQLDELYKVISPSREGTPSFDEQSSQASDHLVSLLEGKDKEVAGSTYQNLLTLVNKIYECGYFDRNPESEEAAETEEASEVPQEAAAEELDSVADISVPVSSSTNEEPVSVPDTVEYTSQVHTSAADLPSTFPTQAAELPGESSLAEPSQQSIDTAVPGTLPMPTETAFYMSSRDVYSQQTTAAAAAAAQRHRPFQEIVSSVQGSFNFLQDSQIETDSHGIDPAVVAAHPMAPVSQTDVGALQSQTAFQPGKILSGAEDPHFTASDLTATGPSDPLVPTDPSSSSHFSPADQSTFDSTAYSADQNFSVLAGESSQNTLYNSNTEQNFSLSTSLAAVSSPNDGPEPIPLPSQTRPGQSLAAGAAPSYGVTGSADSSATFSESQTYSSSGEGQSYGVVESQAYGSTGSTAFGSGDASQAFGSGADNQALSGQEKKPFTMNPHANIFQSMYTQGGAAGMSQQFVNTTAPSSSFTSDRKTFAQTTVQQQQQQQQQQQAEFSQGGFGSSGFSNAQQSGGNQGGYQGQRSGGQRGGGSGNRGNRGSSGMNGNYSRGSSRGGGSAYSGRGGNYSSSRGGNGRGGGSMYPGFAPSRGDYRQDAYQGNTGGMRNGPPSRGGSGGMRGGRGGSYGRSGNMQQGGPMGAGN